MVCQELCEEVLGPQGEGVCEKWLECIVLCGRSFQSLRTFRSRFLCSDLLVCQIWALWKYWRNRLGVGPCPTQCGHFCFPTSCRYNVRFVMRTCIVATAPLSFVMSVHPHYQRCSHWTDSREIWYQKRSLKICRENPTSVAVGGGESDTLRKTWVRFLVSGNIK
jgi:hypothetical protein